MVVSRLQDGKMAPRVGEEAQVPLRAVPDAHLGHLEYKNPPPALSLLAISRGPGMRVRAERRGRVAQLWDGKMTARGVREEARESRMGMQEKERPLSMIRTERACCGDGQREHSA